MGLTRQERQDRLWNKAIVLRDKANKERAFNNLLASAKCALKELTKHGATCQALEHAITNAEKGE